MDYEDLGNELLELAHNKEIKVKVDKIREADPDQLEAMWNNYQLKKTKTAAKQLQNMVTNSLTRALAGSLLPQDEKGLKKDLENNKLLEESVVKLTVQLGADSPYLGHWIAGFTILCYVGYNAWKKLPSF